MVMIPFIGITTVPGAEIDEVPRFDDGAVPNELKAHVREINDALIGMLKGVSSYSHAVALYGFSNLQNEEARKRGMIGLVYPGWESIALRTAATSAHDFDTLFVAFRKALRFLPEWWESVDRNDFKTAVGRFRKTFPHARRMRDAVAHPENFVGTRNTVSGTNSLGSSNYPFVYMENSSNTKMEVVVNGVYTMTVDGKFISSPVTPVAAIELASVANTILRAVQHLPRQ